MRILVFGATGPLGRHVTDGALSAGHQVTAFVRTPGRLAPRPGLQEMAGDVLDASAVAAAVPGHGTQPAIASGPGPVPGASNIIGAMKAARVSRLIWISSHGVGDSRGRSGFLFERVFVPLRLRAEFADKERGEALVTVSDLDWTIIRPARLTNGPRTGRLRAEPRLRISIRNSVSRADVAGFVLTELETGDHLLSAPTVAAA